MFRNSDRKETVLVELTLADGRKLPGKVFLSQSSDLLRVLNGDSRFIEFESHTGKKSIISRSAIVEICEAEMPKVRKLYSEMGDETVDPYVVLGLAKGASAEEVREAYVALTKLYHPDRYSGMDLPKEILNYIDQMSRRINSAYEIIGSVFEHQMTEAAAGY